MKQRMKLNNKNCKFVKSLSVAALAELTFFGAHAYVQRVYAQDFGEGSNRYLHPKSTFARNNPHCYECKYR